MYYLTKCVCLAALTLLAGHSLAEEYQAYSIEPPGQDSDGVTRVLIIHDMEGLSGQDDWRSALSYHEEEYAYGQELLAGDVNAVAEGLFAGGADEVHVADGHGGTNPEPDLRPDLLDPRVAQVFRDKPFDTYTDLAEQGVYDAVAVVGMHAKTARNGFLSHTIGLGTEFIFNGMTVTETEIVAFSFARVGVPVIFASGDNVLREDLHRMPWVEYAEVKQSENAHVIRNLVPLDKARERLTKRARKAVANLDKMKLLRLREPVSAALQAYPPASLAKLNGMPGIVYTDNRVDFIKESFLQAYLSLNKLAVFAQYAGRDQILAEFAAGKLGALTVRNEVFDLLGTLTLEYESGEWRPAPPTPNTKTRYHGY